MKLDIPTILNIRGAGVAAALLIASAASAQNIYVANYNFPYAISSFTPGHSPTTFYSGGGLFQPEGLAFNTAGDLFVANSGNGVVSEITPGPSPTESTFATVGNASGLAFDNTGSAAGYLFVSGYSTGDLYKISPTGTPTTFATGLSSPGAMAFDSAGDLFVGTLGNGSIYEFQNNGGTLSTTASLWYSGLGIDDFGTMAFNTAGSLFLGIAGTSSSNGTVIQITPNKVESTYATGLDVPSGMAFDSAGNLFVDNDGNGTVTEYAPGGGSGTVVASGLGVNTGMAIAGIALPVPEPSTWALTALGALGFLFRRKKA